MFLFLTVILAVTFAGRLTKPIINLISASKSISEGKLDSKVPNIESDEEIKILNENNFNEFHSENNFNKALDDIIMLAKKINKPAIIFGSHYIAKPIFDKFGFYY